MNYVSLQKSQLLDTLENQVLYADLCSVIIAPDGYGKSFILNQINTRMEGQVNLSRIIAMPEMTVDQLEKSISLQLGLSWQQSDDLIERAASRFDQRVFLSIDDAHLLTSTCLDYLIKIVAQQLESHETNLFVILAGDARLAKKLNQTQTLNNNPNLCVVFELEPIEKIETKHLVAAFQSIDVGTAEALYDAQKFDYLWQLSKGVPGELKYQLNRWLNETSVKQESPSKLPAKPKFWLAGLYMLVAFGLILVLIYQREINQFIESEPTKSTQQIATLPDLVREKQTDVSQSGSAKELSSLNSETIFIKADETDASLLTSEGETAIGENNDDNNLVNALDSKIDTAVTDKLPLKIRDDTALQNDVDQVEVNQQNSKAQITQDDEKSTPIIQPSKPNNSNTNEEYTDDEETLLSYADNQYTLQWVGVSSLKSAENFKDSHPLRSQMLIFRRKQGSKYLYLIVSGQFNSRLDADNALQTYQQRNYPGTPWIKSMAAIHKEISSLK